MTETEPMPTTGDEPLHTALANVQARYPVFRGLPVAIQRGQGEGHLEFYAPNEGRNPHPGQITLEIRNPQLTGRWLEEAIAGDLLHHIGGTTGGNRTPNVLPFHQYKSEFIRSMTPEQQFIVQNIYADLKRRGDINPQMTLKEFTQHSGADMFIRGFLFPDQQDEWRKPGFGAYTPRQRQLLLKMDRMIKGGAP